MLSRLTIAVWVKPLGATLTAVNSHIMSTWQPPLTLIEVTTPWTSDVKAARSSMAKAAKRWAAERGL